MLEVTEFLTDFALSGLLELALNRVLETLDLPTVGFLMTASGISAKAIPRRAVAVLRARFKSHPPDGA